MKLRVPPIAFIGLGMILVVLGLGSRPKSEATCNSTIGDSISCGEEIFNKEPNVTVQDDKQAGANAIAAGDYSKAIQLLTKAWEAKKDPETLIMLSNSKLRTQNLPIKTIALSIPGSQSTPLDIPTGMLKAVAHAQQQSIRAA